MEKPALDELPNELVLQVANYLDTARDVASLARSCKQLERITGQEIWRTFVKTRFPTLTLPTARDTTDWKTLAQSLTWQSRCWDRRALTFRAVLPHWQTRSRQTALFHPALDAHLDVHSAEELVAWGAGENVVARKRNKKKQVSAGGAEWYCASGESFGYIPGRDDVRALSIVQSTTGRRDERHILVGRENGSLKLLSTHGEGFGDAVKEFDPSYAAVAITGASRHEGPKQDIITSIDVMQRQNQALATTKRGVFLYSWADDDEPRVGPSAYYDIKRHLATSEGSDLPNVGNAKWMDDDGLLVLALTGKRDPLRYLTVTPSGFTVTTAAKNKELHDRAQLEDERIMCSSIRPIQLPSSYQSRNNLLLSGWQDGTIRLQDIRTPSSSDAIYQDAINPVQNVSSILNYGMERFVAGGSDDPTLKIFDFRWTKSYSHTAALPCGGYYPYPRPTQMFETKTRYAASNCAKCDYMTGQQCRWHEMSTDLHFRPNCNFYYAKSLPREYNRSSVWSLAKSWDVSPTFYAGISGAVVEANLQPADEDHGDVNFDFVETEPPNESGYRYKKLASSMIETGNGWASPKNLSIRMPPMQGFAGQNLSSEAAAQVSPVMRRCHRLDYRFQSDDDFTASF